jgi:hypothetical protein
MKAVSERAEQKMISAGVVISKQCNKNDDMAEKNTSLENGPPPPTADDTHLVTKVGNKEEQMKPKNGLMVRLMQKRMYQAFSMTRGSDELQSR